MLNKNRRFDYILETLRSNLHEGKWVKGDRLPTLQVLAKNFDVSISTIREALRVLQDQGLVSIEQGRGIFVIEEFKNFKKSDKNDFNIIDLMHLNEARLILEPALAENAARQAFLSEIGSIIKSVELMKQLAKENKPTIKEDMNFHMLIAYATHNDVLIEIYEKLQEKLKSSRNYTNIPNMIEKAIHYHSIIAKAIEERDVNKAKSAMEAHISTNWELGFYKFQER